MTATSSVHRGQASVDTKGILLREHREKIITKARKRRKMEIDIRDDDYTGRSPCIGCEREKEDKKECVLKCERLAAYRAGEPWGEKEVVEMEDTEVRDQKSEVSPSPKGYGAASRDQGTEKVTRPLGKMCIIDGCDKKVVARGVCDKHYTAWQEGRIVHPTEGVYKKIRFAKARTAKSKPAQGKKTPVKKTSATKTPPGEIKTPRLDAVTVIDLNDYPRINQRINVLSEKYFVTPGHVILGLLGEALAVRKERASNNE